MLSLILSPSYSVSYPSLYGLNLNYSLPLVLVLVYVNDVQVFFLLFCLFYLDVIF